jgi:hypothetical protein
LLRRQEWVSFVSDNVRRRKAYASAVLSRIGSQREHLDAARRVAEGARGA